MSSEFITEVLRNNKDGSQECRKCKATWTPTSWNFYGLCNSCHAEWAAVRITGISSCDRWLATGRAHDEKYDEIRREIDRHLRN